ncbi:MAG: SDR family NAD(P)-dependent oxidoreductase [Desulfobacterales bacterium]|nr:SDR family NAD(P)-dependent oxidoreductase [Desulfobacterales bacterium]
MKSNDHIDNTNIPIAIIGMESFFSNASGLREFWRLLYRGEDGITDVPETHWSPEDYFDENPDRPDHVYCKRGGFLSPISFDPLEFGIPPTAFEATDTSQLLGLVAAKKALDDSGYGNGKKFNRDKTSVILGVTGTQELVIPLGARLGHPKWRKALEESGISKEKTEEVVERIANSYVSWHENSFPGLLGNVVAGRICNRLDLGGTNCVVDAACASSMSAIHLSLLELVSKKSDMVITGGVDMLNDIFMHMCFSRTQILSPTGDIRPFSKDADGTVLGEGIGMVVIKRLEDAERDGDKIYAVIKGMGSSSDGKSQSIYSPRADGQAKALRTAYKNAGISPETVELIEAHGTGTRVGDMVEFNSLCDVYGEINPNGNRCALGSVKSMIGHTKAAAGSAGLIKTALSLYHKALPPTLKANDPDPRLGIENSPFYLSTQTRPWLSNKEHPRRAGVSAFGFGGSNFHIVLEEYSPQKQEISWDGSVEIFAFSAQSKTDLTMAVKAVQDNLKKNASDSEIAISAFNTRSSFSHGDNIRLLFIHERGQSIGDLFEKALSSLTENSDKKNWNVGNIFYGESGQPGKTAFIFPGQGSQYVGMARDYVCTFPGSSSAAETANTVFGDKNRLSDFIYPKPVNSAEDKKAQESSLRNTDIAQPAIGLASMAMLKALNRFGLKPDAACGHSFGELTALCAAGWIDIETFYTLACERGRLMAKAGDDSKKGAGTMLAVKAPLDEIDAIVQSLGTDDIVLANRNSYDQGVLSGTEDAISNAQKVIKEKGYKTVKLPVAAAFHSKLVENAKKPFNKTLARVTFTPTDIPVYANITGEPYPVDEKAAKKLLGEQIVSPVNFVGEINTLYEQGVRTFVEVGPKTVLTGLVKSILKDKDIHSIAMDSSSGKQFGITDLAKTICGMASLSYPADIKRWNDTSIPEVSKQKMSVPVTGANFLPTAKPLKSKTSDKEPVSIEKENRPVSTVAKKEILKSVQSQTTISAPEQPLQQSVSHKMKKDSTTNSNFISEALSTVQQGLKTMQALQAQTVDAHKKFLDSQTEASRVLQQMMESTKRLAEASMGIAAASPTAPEHTAYVTPQVPDAIQSEPVATEMIQKNIQVDSVETPQQEPAPSGAGNNEISNNILDVVSALTGYPSDMIGLDMDIEADLGIDSIKRVEIFSALEEKMPGLPPVSPEQMGTMRSLGEIVEYLSGVQQTSAPVQDNKTIQNTTAPDNGDSGLIKENILDVVSALTGYPSDMIGLDMDIEADLGIDSIKRVEIFSALEEKMPDLPTVSPEQMGTMKTLEEIITLLSKETSNNILETIYNENSNSCNILNKVTHDNSKSSRIERKTVRVAEKPLSSGKKILLPKDTAFYVTGAQNELSEVITESLLSQNINAIFLSFSELKSKKNRQSAAGLIIVSGKVAGNEFLKTSFRISKKLAPELIENAAIGNSVFATLTCLDGAFGFSGNAIDNPIQGGLAGLTKTAGLEWKNVICRAIDTAPDSNIQDIADAVVSELITPDMNAPVEIGLNGNKRQILELEHTDIDNQTDVNLEKNDVVVITGGARGVTAEAAKRLAVQSKPAIALIGRSQLPEAEPIWLNGIKDPSAVKKAILDNEFSGRKATPAQVDPAYRKYITAREIKDNLDALRAAGSTVAYYAADIRSAPDIKTVLNKIHNELGPVKALIHGAGVLEDRLIVDKTVKQYETVFDTKVKGLEVLLEALKNDDLKYIVFFSSVSARFGNQGQVDYAMANEVLNKVACKEASTRKSCKVISINWGPWDGGMVTPALKREFINRGIGLIPIKAGAESMIREMASNPGNQPEVVIGASLSPDAPNVQTQIIPVKERAPQSKLSLAASREIDTKRFPILKSHVLKKTPVVPFALITEWLGHGALHENPGLSLIGLDNMRILNGIKLNEEKKVLRLMAGKARKTGKTFEVDVEIRNGVKNDKEIIHSKAKAILAGKPSSPPDFISKPLLASSSGLDVKYFYDNILFHGTDLHGIREITNYSAEGMIAKLISAPSPDVWMKDPLRSRWIGDPLALDAAYQMAIIWSYETMGILSLPSYTASYRQYRDKFPAEGITAVLETLAATDHKFTGNFTFLDSDNIVIATISGYEAVMDESLAEAFRPFQSAI